MLSRIWSCKSCDLLQIVRGGIRYPELGMRHNEAMDDIARFRLGVTERAQGRDGPVARELPALADGVSRAVLVEGGSDRVAIEALAAARGRDLAIERVVVVPIGGAMNIRAFLGVLGPRGLNRELAGLCDVGEERFFRRGLQEAGLGDVLAPGDMEKLGFFVCSADLEDELIRCLGTANVEQALESQGDLRAFRTFQNQPAQRGRDVDAQLRRFLGTIGGRKSRYARVLVEALGSAPAPRPLERLLDVTAIST